jgi:thiol-disulfide isomerase/thioredoxin
MYSNSPNNLEELMQRLNFLLVLLLSIITVSNAQTTITGTLLGNDGKPMINACVVLKQPMDNNVVKSVVVDKDGNYKIEVDSTGVWMLYFIGVNHSAYQMALYADTPETENINIRLKTHEYLDDFSDAAVIGNFNDWSHKTSVPMTKNPDGTYSAVVDSKSDTVAYRLIKIAKEAAVEGTEANSYEYNGNDGYNSVIVSKPGNVKIVFDPAKLIKSSSPAELAFSDSASLTAQFAIIYNRIINNDLAWGEAIMDFERSGKHIFDFKYDWSNEVDYFNSQIKDSKIDIIKDELLLGYLNIVALNAKADTAIVRHALEKLSPSSILWSLNPGKTDIIVCLSFQALNPENYIDKTKEYENRMLIVNKSPLVKSEVLYHLFRSAKFQNKIDEASEYLNILISKYPNTPRGIYAKEVLTDAVPVKVGSPVPSFSFVSLDDSSIVVNNESMKGKFYLIDFWATWCYFCVEDLKTLNDVYEKYKNNNFTILSVSEDYSPQDIIKFRKIKWKMPWFNTMLVGDFLDKIKKEFGIIGIPSPILVDDKGIVIAVPGDLYGDNLDKILANLLSK